MPVVSETDFLVTDAKFLRHNKPILEFTAGVVDAFVLRFFAVRTSRPSTPCWLLFRGLARATIRVPSRSAIGFFTLDGLKQIADTFSQAIEISISESQ